MRILLLGILTPGTGNCTTLTRLEGELRAAGHDPHLYDVQELANDHALGDIVTKQHIDVVIGLHALHAGRHLRTVNVPTIIVFGGTDIHEYAKIPSDLKIMTEAVLRARAVVCFDADTRERATGIWPDIATTCEIIPQATQVFANTDWSLREELELPDGALLFVLPAGLRAEKDPAWLCDMFEAWHQVDPRIYQVVIGPVRNQTYATQFQDRIQRCQATLYRPALPQAKLHSALREASAVLNTSQHELMPNSLLEALAIGVPVVARDIPGNRSLIQDGETGLLCSTPDECRTKLERLLTQPDLRAHLVSQGQALIAAKHGPEAEGAAYDVLLRALEQA